MGLIEAIILGIVQGFTEFLPISSSGHLVIGKALFGITEPGIAFEVFVHFGTLLSILVMFRKDVFNMIMAFSRMFTNLNNLLQYYKDDGDFRRVVMILIGTVPAGVIGITFKDTFEAMFTDVRLVGGSLIFTGLILFGTRFVKSRNADIGVRRTIFIGFAQALAIIPGISRSGSSIGAAMFTGVSGEEAARFSFLLAIPAVAGATLLQTLDLMDGAANSIQTMNMVVGAIASFITGCLAIWLLMGAVKRGKISLFAWYCFGVGILTLIITG